MSQIYTFFQDDHQRLDALLEELEQHPHDDDSLALAEAFKAGLERHIRWEEELLFPAFETQTGMHHGGPTAVMCVEHQQIHALLASLVEAVAAGKSPLEIIDELKQVLGEHNLKEEKILYPMCDQVLGPTQVHEIIEGARAD
ncbi:hemerythrin domain-containing protein [Gallaecimonas sp. GXIMD4217]|uniref:hemerythrin domain-containing protein n=1 Tax=Gallaecimonas sp. GXIMD4217 TaxID=3131927 RepID=UPI00311B1DEE